MAVEKMKLISIVGDIPHFEEIVYRVLKSGDLDMVDAMSKINSSSEIYDLSEHVDMAVDLNNLVPFEKDLEEVEEQKLAKEVAKYFNIGKVDTSLISQKKSDFNSLYKSCSNFIEKEKKLKEEFDHLEKIRENLSGFENANVDLDSLKNLEYFKARFGRLEKDARLKIKENYDHILAMIFHTGSYNDEEVYLIIYPAEVEMEISRILNSLNWIDLDVLSFVNGTPKNTILEIENRANEIKKSLQDLEVEKKKFYSENRDLIEATLSYKFFLGKLEETKEKIARSKKYFVITGWASSDGTLNIKRDLKDLGVIITDNINTEGAPPTKLKNNPIVKPFETLIRMYGIPNYNEVDPTSFFAITYMVLFGSMFGDLGQGFIFLLAGLFLRKNTFGPLLVRLGLSSMIFGVLYGSIFGIETIIPALWIRPFENINTVLLISIAFGVFLLVCSYILNFINAYKAKDLEGGFFGEHGFFGFLIFMVLIVLLLDIANVIKIVPTQVAVLILLLSIVVIIFKKPIMGKLKKEDVTYEEGVSGYYIESSFSIIELLISTLSGIVSFIRVGAFAINHVVLFMAFHTMGEMIGNNLGNIIILILGNILIIGLEGLIVFI